MTEMVASRTPPSASNNQFFLSVWITVHLPGLAFIITPPRVQNADGWLYAKPDTEVPKYDLAYDPKTSFCGRCCRIPSVPRRLRGAGQRKQAGPEIHDTEHGRRNRLEPDLR